LNNLIKQAEEDVAEATNTILLKKKTEIVREILTQARQQAREKLRKFIIEGTNQRISQLLSRNPVVLEDIQDSLKLENRQGAMEVLMYCANEWTNVPGRLKPLSESTII
jgi:molybdopterin-guanine dinucleotide biosynthesis protein A